MFNRSGIRENFTCDGVDDVCDVLSNLFILGLCVDCNLLKHFHDACEHRHNTGWFIIWLDWDEVFRCLLQHYYGGIYTFLSVDCIRFYICIARFRYKCKVQVFLFKEWLVLIWTHNVEHDGGPSQLSCWSCHAHSLRVTALLALTIISVNSDASNQWKCVAWQHCKTFGRVLCHHCLPYLNFCSWLSETPNIIVQNPVTSIRNPVI